jgi:hypothetical protein
MHTLVHTARRCARPACCPYAAVTAVWTARGLYFHDTWTVCPATRHALQYLMPAAAAAYMLETDLTQLAASDASSHLLQAFLLGSLGGRKRLQAPATQLAQQCILCTIQGVHSDACTSLLSGGSTAPPKWLQA